MNADASAASDTSHTSEGENDPDVAALQEEVADLRQQVRHQSEYIDILEDEMQARDERIDDLESRLEEFREAVSDRLAELDDRTDLFRMIGADLSGQPKKRAAICIQVLRNEAKDRDPPRASMTVGESCKALGGDVARQHAYGESGTFQAAESLVGDTDVLEFIKENRGADRNTRLVLDLSEGEIPGKVDELAEEVTGE